MRKLLTIIMSMLLLISVPLTAFATSELPMIVDHADLLSGDEEAYLEDAAQQIRNQFEMDVVILTVDSLQGKSA